MFKSVRSLFLIIALAFATLVGTAHAGDAVIDQAKAEGIIGERIDGYIGVVSNADASLQRKVDEINTRRREVYSDLAERSGQSLSDIARLTGVKIVGREPSGHFVFDDSGRWVRKP